jgi:FkbM family methyltransferase
MMKKKLRRLLENFGVFYRLRYSRTYQLFLDIFQPDRLAGEKREVDFYRSFLPECSLVFDIGGYDGHKTAAFLHFSQNVVCCEPDATNFRLLKERFRSQKKRVMLENVALGDQTGSKEYFIHHEGSAFNTMNKKFLSVIESDDMQRWREKVEFKKEIKVAVTTLDDLIKKFGKPEFIKIDTEGYELNVIRGLNQPVKFISAECLIPEFLPETIAIMNHLSKHDTGIRFNVSEDEKLIFEEFKSAEEIIRFFTNTDKNHFELIAHSEIA